MRSVDLVRRYFDREARRFDAIYDQGKPLPARMVDRIFRSVVVERFKLICNLAPVRPPWSVLDVGCGSGRYSIELAARGASRVLGIDVSPQMVDLARKEAAAAGADLCEFLVSDFAELRSEERFDVVIATGYFDYLDDPLTHLRGMVGRCSGRVFASFPKRYEYRVPLRKLRFRLAGGYVRFYSTAELKDLFAKAGVAPERLSVIDLGRDLVAIAYLG